LQDEEQRDTSGSYLDDLDKFAILGNCKRRIITSKGEGETTRPHVSKGVEGGEARARVTKR